MAIKFLDYKSSLNVKLSFEETTKKGEYFKIRERLKIPQNIFDNSTQLSKYLEETEGIKYSKTYSRDLTPDRERKILIKSNPRKMTLEVSVTSDKPVPEDLLLNVVHLDKFISTGECPKY